MDTRESWHKYFLSLAEKVSTRATCDRKHVGSVIVRDNNILATGYNGSIKGAAHCDDVGHMMIDTHCKRTVHSEANAIAQAAKNGVALKDSTIYITASPCWECFKLIINAGISEVFYKEFYRDSRVIEEAKKLGFKLQQI